MYTKIKELTSKNNSTFLMVKDVAEKETKNKKPYVVLSLADGEDVIQAKVWDSTMSQLALTTGNVIHCSLEIKEYKGQLDYVLKDYAIDTQADISQFVKHSPIPVATMYNDIMAKISAMQNEDLRKITLYLLTENKDIFIHNAAGMFVHHDGLGELLYHSYRMMYVGMNLCSFYKANRELVMAGCILHDIGKVQELATDNFANTTYTVDGQLESHITIGMDMVKSVGRLLGTNPEIIRNLVHIIASHHAEPEFGAVSRPKTLEAFIVSQCDYIDSHAYIHEAERKKLKPGEVSTEKNFALQTRVYRPAL